MTRETSAAGPPEGLCLVAARRTPQGRFLGALKEFGPVELACAAAGAALDDLGRPAIDAAIDQVIVGNVLGAGHGMNIARQIGVRLGLPVTVPACTVNMMCGSGLEAMRLAALAIRGGGATTVLCGGTESMSTAAYLVPRVRQGLKLGDATLVDSILRDGLVDAFDHRHMALQAEELGRQFGISRDAQDAWAVASQQRHAAAAAAGRFADELVATGGLTADEHPRPGTNAADLAKLKPAFAPDGTVTAGNASGINDGAAVVVMTTLDRAAREGWPVLCRWLDATTVGCAPDGMGLGPVHALRALAARQAFTIDALDAVEINEAFAAQMLACAAELRLDPARVNADGGAIAVGHPIGASGARLAVHLARQIARGEIRQAAAALCVGGGMGIACLLRAA